MKPAISVIIIRVLDFLFIFMPLPPVCHVLVGAFSYLPTSDNMSSEEKLKKKRKEFNEELKKHIEHMADRNASFIKGITDSGGDGPFGDKYYVFPLDADQRSKDILNLRQNQYFTRTRDSDLRISFLHWMHLRVVLDKGETSLTAGAIRERADMLKGLSTMLQMYNKECSDLCKNVHELGRMGWHSLVNLSLLLRDFCHFCTRLV